MYTSRLNRIFGPPRARIPAPGGRRPGTAARQSQAQAEGRLRREAARVSCQWSPVLRLLSRGCAQGRRSSLGRGDHRGLCVGQFATGSPNVSEQNELARASGDWKSGHWARSPFARAGRRSLKHGPSLRTRRNGQYFSSYPVDPDTAAAYARGRRALRGRAFRARVLGSTSRPDDTDMLPRAEEEMTSVRLQLSPEQIFRPSKLKSHVAEALHSTRKLDWILM